MAAITTKDGTTICYNDWGKGQPDLAATQKKFFATLSWPSSQARVTSLLQRGLQQRGDVELRLGHHLAAQ